ncbi:MAG: oligosaccharide flippase family protein, partial [Clostridium butyricum]|nr:oligosaccharide flippase family protein [Clostridium butyricum]
IIGAEGIGRYSYTYSIANYFVLIAMLGINNYGNRSIARDRDNKEKLNKTFSSILVFHIIISVIMILAYILYIIYCVNDEKIMFIIQFVFVFSALFDINWFFFGMEEFKLTVTRNAIIKIMSAISIFAFVKTKEDLWLYSLILAIGALISQVALWPFVKNFVCFKKPTINEILCHVKPCSVLFIPVISVSIYKIMNKIMLGSMSDMIQVGFYENADKIICIPLGFIAALGTVMLPKMSNIKVKGLKKESEQYLEVSMKFAMFIAIGSIFGLIGVSPILIPLFLGNEFLESIKIVSLLSVTILFIGWANVLRTQYVIPNRLDSIHATSTLIGAIVNIFVNIPLIFKYGAVGATIGTILSEFSVAMYVTIKIRRNIPIVKYVKNSIPFLFSGMFMFIFIKAIQCFVKTDSIIILIIQVIAGGSVYLLINYLYILKIESKRNLSHKFS